MQVVQRRGWSAVRGILCDDSCTLPLFSRTALSAAPPPPALVLDPSLNPRVSFRVRLPFLSPASYPNGTVGLMAAHR